MAPREGGWRSIKTLLSRSELCRQMMGFEWIAQSTHKIITGLKSDSAESGGHIRNTQQGGEKGARAWGWTPPGATTCSRVPLSGGMQE